MFDVNISSYENGQVTLLNFGKKAPNGIPSLWLHHLYFVGT